MILEENISRKDLTISVIIPVFEREKELNRALGSIYLQTLKPNEVIIIDDSKVNLEIEEINSKKSLT